MHGSATTTLTGPVVTYAAGCDAPAARIQRWLPSITGSKHRSPWLQTRSLAIPHCLKFIRNAAEG